ncbi:unnamed protein product [Phytophthora fragariaefolia]|uniref:Unnamed protein product n=1 Tax=Phytophthora fragariaefolia TaxID=1490495 RepID=A0A9W7D6K2_9STRA|nr:unnamed protein product [Phytophthora fragariaefolia]
MYLQACTPILESPPGARASMPKSTTKGKKAQQAVEAPPKVRASRMNKSLPKKTSSTTETAPSAKPTRRSKASKRTVVHLPGPYVEAATCESGTDTPNRDLTAGDEDSEPYTAAPRVPKPNEDPVAVAKPAASKPAPTEEGPTPSSNDTSDARKAVDVLTGRNSHEPSVSATVPTPVEVPKGQSSPPEDGPGPMGYEESEPDQNREQGGVPDPTSSPQRTEQQRDQASVIPVHDGTLIAPRDLWAEAPALPKVFAILVEHPIPQCEQLFAGPRG